MTQNNETEPTDQHRIRFLPVGEPIAVQTGASRRLDGAMKALSIVLLMVIVAAALLLVVQ